MSDLAEHHDELRSVARALLAGDAGAAVPVARLAEVGWLGLEVPEALGGSGATFAELAVVLQELARAATRSAVLGSTVLGVGALLAVEPDPERDALLGAIAAGGSQVAVALTARADDALVDVPFRLDRSEQGLALHGRAELVVDADHADRLLLVARDPDQRLVLVEVPPASLEVAPRPVLDETRRFADVAADWVVVEATSIRPFGSDDGVQHLLDRLAVALACDGLGVAEGMLDATVAYVSEREQFGRPVGSFQAVKHACADLLVQVTLARRLVAAAVDAIGSDDPGAGLAASRAKAYATEVAVAVAGEAMQLHGAIGYSWESGIHVHLKRAVLDRSLAGNPATHRRRIAASLLAATSGSGP